METQVQKDVLRCIITARGERCVITDSLTQQRESFATLSDTDTPDGLLVTATVAVEDEFGWTTFDAMARNLTSQNADTTVGAVTTVNTAKMFPSRVSPTRLKPSRWLEEIHELDVLKCFTARSGEPFVRTDSLTQQQESFAILLDSAMSEEKWTLTSTVWATGLFGLTTSSAMGQNGTSANAHTATGEFTAVGTIKMSPSLASITRRQLMWMPRQRQSLQ